MSNPTAEESKSGYLVLARKYRPRTFSEVVGQEAVVKTLQNALKENRVAHAYLFSGMRGVGKTTVARILAKALNCEKGPTPEPCNVCFMCQAINEEKLLDFIEIDGASNRSIEDVKALRESVQYEPMHSRYRVIIIDEVHQLSRDAFNALLKTLEEPPTRTVFIFATTEFHKVPRTIVSRCQHFVFKKLSIREIISHLKFIAGKEGLIVSDYSLKLVAEAADGSLRDAETLLDQLISFAGNEISDHDAETVLGVIDRNLFQNMVEAILQGKSEKVFDQVENLISAGYDLRYFYSGLIEFFRNLLVLKVTEKPEEFLLVPKEDLETWCQLISELKAEEILRYLLILQEGEAGLRYSSQPRIFLESWLIKLCYLPRLKPLEKVLREIDNLKAEIKGKVSIQNSTYQVNPVENKAVKQAKFGNYQKAEKSSPMAANKNGFTIFGNEIVDQLYNRLVREKPTLAPIFKIASRVEVNNEKIRLIYSSDKKHFAALIERDLAFLNRLASEVSSKGLELEIVPGSQAEAEPRATLKPGERSSGTSHGPGINGQTGSFLEDPKARAVLETLKGHVVGVKKKNSVEKNHKT
ncbi:MAG: DNA polymerase III subunit gamma/tau [Candidatus Aminicenantes bacterium]|nr:DNA polymerase III subunit gamma/tau [Candidatus Aminicenantes bacterium]